MTPKLLLVKSITLLYRESQLPDPKERSVDLVRTIVSAVKISEVNLGISHEDDVLNALKTTALTMCEDPSDVQYESTDLLQRLRIDCGEDDTLYNAFKDALSLELSDSSIKRTCVGIKRLLHDFFREEEAITIINKANKDLKFGRDKIKNIKNYIREHIQSLEPYTMDTVTKDPAIVSEVDFSDIESMNNVFKKVKTMDDGTGIMKTGWQCWNRMLRGGFRRGEEVVMPALQHNGKTTISLILFKQLALYNEPYMIDPTKKPLLLRISFEDDLTLNMQFLYTNLKENETGVKVDNLHELSEEEMSKYVHEKLSVNGYHIKLMRVDPSQWTYTHICNKILELEAEGYEIHLLMLDYLFMVPTTGCSQGPAGHDVRDLFRRIRNFTSQRGIITFTPHQVSTDGKQLIRDGVGEKFVQEIANKGYYAGSRQIDQEVDLEIYIHIVKMNNASWLTVQRGKHRIPGVTRPEYLNCILKFSDVGTIPDDINGPDTSRKKIGGGMMAEGQDNLNPFWGDDV